MKKSNKGVLFIVLPFVIFVLDLFIFSVVNFILFSILNSQIGTNSTDVPTQYSTIAMIVRVVFSFVGLITLVAAPFSIVYGIVLLSAKSKVVLDQTEVKTKN